MLRLITSLSPDRLDAFETARQGPFVPANLLLAWSLTGPNWLFSLANLLLAKTLPGPDWPAMSSLGPNNLAFASINETRKGSSKAGQI